MATFEKDPGAYLDYSQNWTDWMRSGDAIATSTWDVPTGLIAGTKTATATIATVWIRGGTVGVTYKIVNHIVTTQGREDSRTIDIVIQKR